MKLITINVEDEEHTKIKLAATKAGLSIKDYLLNRPATKPEWDIAEQKWPIKSKTKIKPSPGYSVIDPSEAFKKFCKHGADPKMCKFAKNGKPCK